MMKKHIETKIIHFFEALIKIQLTVIILKLLLITIGSLLFDISLKGNPKVFIALVIISSGIVYYIEKKEISSLAHLFRRT